MIKLPHVKDLVEMPILREECHYEPFSKMTDEQEELWEKQTEKEILEENNGSYKDFGIHHLAKHIDYCILYDLFKMNI